jgi:hypothetical protein
MARHTTNTLGFARNLEGDLIITTQLDLRRFSCANCAFLVFEYSAIGFGRHRRPTA